MRLRGDIADKATAQSGSCGTFNCHRFQGTMSLLAVLKIWEERHKDTKKNLMVFNRTTFTSSVNGEGMNGPIDENELCRANAIGSVVVDAAIEVHRTLGPGFLESVYEAAMCHELRLRKQPFERQRGVTVRYKGEIVGEGRLDLVIGNLVVIELKAQPTVTPIHVAQVLSYLKATQLPLGFVLNFGGTVMKAGIRRVLPSTVAFVRPDAMTEN